jgi:hypothetical protein
MTKIVVTTTSLLTIMKTLKSTIRVVTTEEMNDNGYNREGQEEYYHTSESTEIVTLNQC